MWKMTITQMKEDVIGERIFNTLQTVEVVAKDLAGLSIIGEKMLETSEKALTIQFERVELDEVNG